MLKRILVTVSVLALAGLLFPISQVDAKPKPSPGCNVRDNGCTASNVTFQLEPNPTPPLPVCNVTLYSLNTTISCGLTIGGGTSVSLLVCPSTSQPASITIDGRRHTFEPAPGRKWQDVINNCSSYLTYSVN